MSDCGNVQKVFVPDSDEPDKVEFELAKEQGLLITDYAADKISGFLQKSKKDSAEYGLTVNVVKDGCSGMSYQMDFGLIQEAKDQEAKLFVHKGVTVIVQKSAYFYVFGSILDYVESLTGSGFNLKNPNVKRSCSCGSSFSV